MFYKKNKFAQRLNTSISRAKYLLIVIGNEELLSQHLTWKKWENFVNFVGKNMQKKFLPLKLKIIDIIFLNKIHTKKQHTFKENFLSNFIFLGQVHLLLSIPRRVPEQWGREDGADWGGGVGRERTQKKLETMARKWLWGSMISTLCFVQKTQTH